jgi:peptidyl-prolyl cis-trans isomerase B (cyclophilin B)
MKFTITFILLVVVGIIGLVIITTRGSNESTDVANILSQATGSASLSPGQQNTNTNPNQQNPRRSSTPKEELKSAQKATITTSKGDIVLTLFPDVAPKTVSNFVTKSQGAYYDDLTFHRVEAWVIQGGDPKGDGTGGGDIETELNSKPFVKGSLGVARGGNIEISNDSQFFITKTEADWLNNQYTNFGIVTQGLEVVEQIEKGDRIISITTE